MKCHTWWENQQHAFYYEGTPMCHHKTACFEALVLGPRFTPTLRPLLATLSYPWLAEVRCKHLINFAAHVLNKPWLLCCLQKMRMLLVVIMAVAICRCFTRKRKIAMGDSIDALAPKRTILFAFWVIRAWQAMLAQACHGDWEVWISN